MGIWLTILIAYVIARKKNLRISEWLEIVMAGMGLYLILHL